MPLPALPALNISMDVSRPKGSRGCFESAVRRLAPYQGIWVKDDGTKQKLSKGFAEEAVEGIARMYNTNRYLERQAPRSAAVIKKIQNLKRHADGLNKELKELDDLTTRIIYGEARLRSKDAKRLGTFEAGDIGGLRKCGDIQSAWHRRISNFAESLSILAAELPPQWERRGHAVKDRGAKRNHFTESEGTARWRLYTDALAIHNVFKPGKATGSEESDLHHFVNEIFEYATGHEANDGVIRPLRALIKPTREENQIKARNDQILQELENMAPGKTIDLLSDEELKRMSELHKELSQNRDRRAELSKLTWPHCPMSLLLQGNVENGEAEREGGSQDAA